MTDDIQLVYNDKEYTIPNRWETISPEHYLQLTADLLRFSSGELSPGQVRINHLCRIMNWQKRRFRTEEQIANLVAISQQLTFLFQIDYLDNNDILDTLDAHSRNLCKHIPPHRLNIPMARVLQKLNYQYVVNLCFFAQLLPTVTIDNKVYHAPSSRKANKPCHFLQLYSIFQAQSTTPNEPTPSPNISQHYLHTYSQPSPSIFKPSTPISSQKHPSHSSPSSNPPKQPLSQLMPQMLYTISQRMGSATPRKSNKSTS